MKKFVSVLLCTLLLVCVMGCGQKVAADPAAPVTLSWDGYTLSHNGNILNITEHTGDAASVDKSIGLGGLGYRFAIDMSKDVTNISVNTQGILEENMDKIKDMFYYGEYNASVVTGARNIGGEYWAIGIANTEDTPMPLVAEHIRTYLETMPLTDKGLYVDVAGKFTFGSEWYNTIARPDKILVKDIIQVLPGQVHPKMDSYTFYKEDGTALSGMFASTDAYDYYYYDGFTIQCAKGVNMADFIKFQ